MAHVKLHIPGPVEVSEKTFTAVSAAIKAGHLELQTQPLSLGQLILQIIRMLWMNVKGLLLRRGLLARESRRISRLDGSRISRFEE